MMLHSLFRGLAERYPTRVSIMATAAMHGRDDCVYPYVLDGVQVLADPAGLSDVDVLVTHLDRTPQAMNLAEYLDVPLVHIVHNHEQLDFHGVRKADLVVYNSAWLAAKVGRPGIIVRPPVWPEDYRVEPSGQCVTLINPNIAKGAHVFYELARRMPETRFLAVVGGYGLQIKKRLPNVTIVGPLRDMREAYRETRVLLMPSDYESWGRCAIEAAISGIPCLAHSTPGLTESLASGGNFVDCLEVDAWEKALEKLLSKWASASKRAKARAAQLDPQVEVDTFEAGLLGVVS